MLLHRIMRVSALLATVVAFGLAGPATAEEKIRIGGTGAGSILLQHLVSTYQKTHPKANIAVIMPPLGSNGSSRALADGSIQIAVVSVLPETLVADTMSVVEWVKTPFVFVGKNLPAGTHMTHERLVDIYAGRYTQWPNATPVRLVTRTERESDTKVLRSISPAMNAAVTAAQQRPGMPFAENDVENQKLLEHTEGSFGAIALGQLRLSESRLNPVVIDGTPTADGLGRKDTARFFKTFGLIVTQTPSPETRNFLRYLRSPEALRQIEPFGFTRAGT